MTERFVRAFGCTTSDCKGVSVKNWGFGQFLGKRPLRLSNILHDGRGQWSVSFEYGAIFWENFNP